MERRVYSDVSEEVVLWAYFNAPSACGTDECRFEQPFVRFYVAFQRGLHGLIPTFRSDDALSIGSKVDGAAFSAKATSTIVAQVQFIFENLEVL